MSTDQTDFRIEAHEPDEPESLIIGEAQLLLAEKRTSLAAMRTGIAVFALPLSVVSVLIATSKYYEISDVMLLFYPLLGVCTGLVVLGVYLTHRAVRKIRHYDDMLLALKKENSKLARFFD